LENQVKTKQNTVVLNLFIDLELEFLLIGSSPEKPIYYGPQDFYIGAVVTIFKHKFRIVGADLHVLKFAEEHANQFPNETLQSLRQHLGHITGRLDARERSKISLKRG
jgi:hypothetical protein